MKKHSRNSKGFTLVELIIVIAIIGILASVLVPSYISYIENANLANDKTNVKNMNTILSLNSIDDNVSYYSSEEILFILTQENNYTLKSKSKNWSYWYNRSNNTIELRRNSDVSLYSFGSNSNVLLSIRSDEYNYDIGQITSDSAYVYIEQKDNSISRALNTIRNLVNVSKSEATRKLGAQPTYNQILSEMVNIFNSLISVNSTLSQSVKDHISI